MGYVFFNQLISKKYLAVYPLVSDAGFHVVFWILVSMGSVLNYSLFLCTALNSALTTSLVAVAKSVIQTLIGLFVFGGIKFHPLNIVGESLYCSFSCTKVICLFFITKFSICLLC